MGKENTNQEQKQEIKGFDIYIEEESERIPHEAELRVKSDSDAKKLAGAIFAKVKEHGHAKLRCIGPAAIGQAFKAYTIASGHLKLNDTTVIATGAFFKVRLKNGEVRDGMYVNVEPQ